MELRRRGVPPPRKPTASSTSPQGEMCVARPMRRPVPASDSGLVLNLERKMAACVRGPFPTLARGQCPRVHPAVAEPSELGTSLSGNRSGHRAIPLPASAGSLEPIHCTRSHSLVLRLAGCLTRRAAVSHFGLCSAWRRPSGGGRPALHRAARRAAPSGDAPRKGAQALAACAGGRA